MRRAVERTATGLALLAAACTGSPAGIDGAERFRLDPSDVVVDAGGSVRLVATAVDRYGTPINTPVQAQPCDELLTTEPDAGRTAFEFPERFTVTAADTLDATCLIVTGAGMTANIEVLIVPASIVVLGPAFLSVGATGSLDVQFLSAAGLVVTGLTTDDLTFATSDASVATIGPDGVVTGVSEGAATIDVALADRFPVTRLATFTVQITP